jgi:hypothetical protein
MFTFQRFFTAHDSLLPRSVGFMAQYAPRQEYTGHAIVRDGFWQEVAASHAAVFIQQNISDKPPVRHHSIEMPEPLMTFSLQTHECATFTRKAKRSQMIL